ncbi:hypothetical protein [Murimonas intestini]|uniref:hypothetical protein n=1 Tax=Murimonas intestini TaxID=1337051 RepID=UPI0011DD433C|nr:hypothetical protein [Murimonas intestini]
METCVEIGKVNLKYHLSRHLLIAAAFLVMSPLLISVRNLEPAQTAQSLEMYAALIGIILLVPIFLPDQDKNIRDLTAAKYTPALKVQMVRLAESFIFLVLLLGAFTLYLKTGGCEFPVLEMYAGVLSEAFFLGGLGIAAYGLSDNVIIGYMIPIVYYAANFSGDKYLKNFYLFSMMQDRYEPKIWLACAGVVLICAGLGVRQIKR